MKTKISVYDCDTMIVAGTSYYLWVMDYYKVTLQLSLLTLSSSEIGGYSSQNYMLFHLL